MSDLYHDVYKRFAQNLDVYDGDSIRADIDEGDYRWEYQRPLRLYGVDAPELAPLRRNYEGDEEGRELEKAYAREARDRAREYIEAAEGPILVQTVKLPGKPVRDKYGRTLARVFVPIGGQMVDLGRRLLGERHARPYDGGTKNAKWVPLRELGKGDPPPDMASKIL